MPAISSRFRYLEDDSRFALIRVPDGNKAPADAIMSGSLSAVMEPVLSTRARADALDLLARADEAAEQERERVQRERGIVIDGIRAIADGIAKLSRRLDAIERSQAARHKLDAASEATAQMLALPQDVPDPDAPDLALADYTPAPGGVSFLRCSMSCGLGIAARSSLSRGDGRRQLGVAHASARVLDCRDLLSRNSFSNACASFRLRVSNPSVNHP